MNKFNPLMDKIRNLFAVTRLAVLATDDDGSPYTSLVAFAASDNLREIYFATSKETRKYHYLKANCRVAFLVDNRSETGGDFREGIAVTILGMATELHNAERESALASYVANLPDLADFVSSPTCALFRATVSSYSLVEEFEKISEHRFDR